MPVVIRALRLPGRAPIPLTRKFPKPAEPIAPHLGGNELQLNPQRDPYADTSYTGSTYPLPPLKQKPSHRLAARKEARKPQVHPGLLSHLVTGEPPAGKFGSRTQRELMLQDEMGDFELGEEEGYAGNRPPRQAGQRGQQQQQQQQKRRGYGLRQDDEYDGRPREREYEGRARERERTRDEGARRSDDLQLPQQDLPPVPVWGKGQTWRDLDTANLERIYRPNVITLPADFNSTITAANSRRVEKVSVWYPLFYGMSVPAAHIPGGGAPDNLPPFHPPMSHDGYLPDGRIGPADPSSPYSRHMADTSADARAGTGFAYPAPATETDPAKVRLFVLAPKAKLSRLSVERRRCRNRFLQAWRHVVNRTEGVPPLSHKRVYSFVLNPEIYEAPFTDICAFVEKAIYELHQKLTSPRLPRDRQRAQNMERRAGGSHRQSHRAA